MSRDNDGCGCFAQLIVVAVIVLIYVGVSFYDSTEYAQMKEARKSNTRELYVDYLKKHADGDYADEARDSIVSIYERSEPMKDSYYGDDKTWLYSDINTLENDRVCERLCRIAYRKTQETNTIDAWKRYREKVPTRYYWDSQKKIDEINYAIEQAEKAKWGTEGRAWKTASELNTIEGYEKYFELYPNGSHKAKARKALIDAQVSAAFKGKHGAMPQMDKTSYGYGSTSEVKITNQTQYTMTLLYSGTAESYKLEIPANATRSINLLNGKYRISASVAASNVIPYTGTETLTGGGYEASYYIHTTTTRY